MRIAIPVADGALCAHFGHCQQFVLIDADDTSKAITHQEAVVPPPHQPGLLPRWLAERGATVVIAGGMGGRAQGLFAQHGITVVVGAPCETPERLARDFLAGTLQRGENLCDH